MYMEQPNAFVNQDHPTWGCQILQSIYSLKQSPQQWNTNLHQFLISVGLSQSYCNNSIYYSKEKNALVDIFVVHVDDLAITGLDTFINNFIKNM